MKRRCKWFGHNWQFPGLEGKVALYETTLKRHMYCVRCGVKRVN